MHVWYGAMVPTMWYTKACHFSLQFNSSIFFTQCIQIISLFLPNLRSFIHNFRLCNNDILNIHGTKQLHLMVAMLSKLLPVMFLISE